MNQVTIQFAKGGFIVTTRTEQGESTEIVNSVGKLNKAVRSAVEDLSLLPKKADDAE